MTSCSKCKNTLTPEEVGYKMICDYCNDIHCQACSGLSKSEAYVTRLSKQRILIFACERCAPMAKNCVRTSSTELDQRFGQLQLNMEKILKNTLAGICDSMASSFRDQFENLSRDLLAKIEKQFKRREPRSSEPKNHTLPESGQPQETAEPKVVEPPNGSGAPSIDLQQVRMAISEANLQKYIDLTSEAAINGNLIANAMQKHTITNGPLPQTVTGGPVRSASYGFGGIVAAPRGRNVVVGTADTNPDPSVSLTAAAPTAALHISNLNVTVTEEMVKKHIEKIIPQVVNSYVSVTKLRGSDSASSFKLTVPQEHLDLVFNADIWPRGVYIKKWQYFPWNQRQTSGGDTALGRGDSRAGGGNFWKKRTNRRAY